MRRLKALTILFAALLISQAAPVVASTGSDDRSEPAAHGAMPEASDAIERPAMHKDEALLLNEPAAPPLSREEICQTIESAAAGEALPVEFFARLIWQESRFNPAAVSPAGAKGIAQFMPKTAAGRGLADPFEPVAALKESAEFLRELRAQFGNLGLAAAAYNAGPKRVQDWLAKRGVLPRETQDYVRLITGHAAEKWAAADAPEIPEVASKDVWCNQTDKLIAQTRSELHAERAAQNAERAAQARKEPPVEAVAKLMVGARKPLASEKPAKLTAQALNHAIDEKGIKQARAAPRSGGEKGSWGVQVDWSEAKATAARWEKKLAGILRGRRHEAVAGKTVGRGATPLHRIRLAADSREGAEKLCSQLKAAGGTCVVLRNPAKSS
jgi:Transglycosylase SLT domain/SPOR domain